jgi:hypothetical protein
MRETAPLDDNWETRDSSDWRFIDYLDYLDFLVSSKWEIIDGVKVSIEDDPEVHERWAWSIFIIEHVLFDGFAKRGIRYVRAHEDIYKPYQKEFEIKLANYLDNPNISITFTSHETKNSNT